VTTTALFVLLAADAVEFSWRYQLPAVTLLPAVGVLGLAAWRRTSATAAAGQVKVAQAVRPTSVPSMPDSVARAATIVRPHPRA
jgi:hypothetical protein